VRRLQDLAWDDFDEVQHLSCASRMLDHFSIFRWILWGMYGFLNQSFDVDEDFDKSNVSRTQMGLTLFRIHQIHDHQ
jgi:hypothetical protein